ncbi:MAG TPA: aldo/keto reductase [Acetobacteraceae bacterium]|nr:aldo/keto reductase [Acetobacteraceae bacterium]
MPTSPPRYRLAPDLEISRIVTGLWQVADMERDGHRLDLDAAAAELAAYAEAGFDSFDMADHYGSAEDIAGRFLARHAPDFSSRALARPAMFTKWCPTPAPMTAEVVRAGIQRSLGRLGVSAIDLLQFHWWDFAHLAWLDAARELAKLRHEGPIRHLGVANFDTDHLRVLVAQGVPLAANQVCFSLLDRRAAGEMSAFCLAHGIRLLAYGTLGGGLLSERWLGAAEPAEGGIADWSKMKYRRFVEAIGGWGVLQRLLTTLDVLARKHGVSIANVATRWVLEQPAVAAVIVGARLGQSEHRGDNLRAFAFALDAADHAAIDAALAGSVALPGDCGDEYRHPPYLTASGDLSHHLEGFPHFYQPMLLPGGRRGVDSGSIWEVRCGFSRAVRTGNRILVSGTTATAGSGERVSAGDVAGQAAFILDKIAASLAALGGRLEDVVRTRIYLTDVAQWEAVSRVHGHVFERVRPANTLVQVAGLIGNYGVEIEAEAELS